MRVRSDLTLILLVFRVMYFGQYIAGPIAAMLLHDHSADVMHRDAVVVFSNGQIQCLNDED